MRVAGTIVTIFGAAMVLSSTSLAFTKYDLNDSHDLSVFLGGLGVSLFLLVLGLRMLKRGPEDD